MTMKLRLGMALVAALTATSAFAIDARVRVEDNDIESAAMWKVIGGFCDIQKWHPAVEKCELSKKDGQDVRTLVLKGGGQVVEQLVSRDEKKMSYTYKILEGVLPVEDYVSTITVSADDDGGGAVLWTGKFKAKGASDADAKKTIEGVYKGGIEGILKVAGAK